MKVIREGVLTPWKEIGERDVQMKTRFMEAWIQGFRHPVSGKEYSFSQIEIGNYVSVFTITREGNVVLTSQWKQGTKMVCPQPPGGAVKGEDVEQAARDILLRELGYKAGSVVVVPKGKFHFFDSRSPNFYYVALAYDCEQVDRPDDPDASVIHVVEYTSDEFWELLDSGEVHEPATFVGARFAWRHHLLPL